MLLPLGIPSGKYNFKLVEVTLCRPEIVAVSEVVVKEVMVNLLSSKYSSVVDVVPVKSVPVIVSTYSLRVESKSALTLVTVEGLATHEYLQFANPHLASSEVFKNTIKSSTTSIGFVLSANLHVI